MTRRYAHLIAVAILIAACSAPISPQQDTIEELRARAEQGDAIAMSNLGTMYFAGRGVPQDDAEAVRWYGLAADQGDEEAQFRLGLMYDTGLGVPQQDDAVAVRWYGLAAEQGHAKAMSVSAPSLGPYSVTAKIGAGGMGQVYRATDTQLGRTR